MAQGAAKDGKQPQQQPMRRKSPAEIRDSAAPYRPAPYEPADVVAIKALYDGKASPDQQRRALEWIIEKASNCHDLAYRPGGEDGRRDTDFALGMQKVGKEIIKLVKLPKKVL